MRDEGKTERYSATVARRKRLALNVEEKIRKRDIECDTQTQKDRQRYRQGKTERETESE